MDINFTHKPNYFFFAERFIGFLKNKLQLQPNTPNQTHLSFPLAEIYNIFHQDFASTTTNLDGILNIANKYTVNEKPFIHTYIIDGKYNTLDLELNPHAIEDLQHGHHLAAPDATL